LLGECLSSELSNIDHLLQDLLNGSAPSLHEAVPGAHAGDDCDVALESRRRLPNGRRLGQAWLNEMRAALELYGLDMA
jgi:hypothetical protein